MIYVTVNKRASQTGAHAGADIKKGRRRGPARGGPKVVDFETV